MKENKHMKTNRLKIHFVEPSPRSSCGWRARLARVFLLLAPLLSLAMVTVTSAQTTYTVTDIGTLGGALTSATGINSSGDVVGFSGIHGFLWRNGTMTDLGGLGSSSSCIPYGINDSGTVVGQTGDFGDIPFRYTSGSGMVRLGPFYPLTLNEVDAINGTGQIVGQGQDFTQSCAPYAAMIYYNGAVQNLVPTDCGFNVAQAINASGQSAGLSDDFDPNNRHACLFSGGHITDLGTLPSGTFSEATGINDSGQIVGWGNINIPSYHLRAFIYSAGTMTNLGSLYSGSDSQAFGINNAGQVVGESNGRAFIYTASGGMVDLNLVTNLGGFMVLRQARAINNSGQIAGYGDFSDGNEHAFLLTPTTSTHPPFFTGEVPLGNGIYYLQFPNGTPFGYYSYLTAQSFIYHFDMGYEYWFDANDGHGGIYFYDFASNHFFYTSPSFPFPYLYDFSLNAVLYYYPAPNNPGHYTTNPRYFYNFATGQIITM